MSDHDAAAEGGDQPRRERILMAAAEEFAAKGFAAVRTDEIARKAGCNKQLIFYYFQSKAGLRDAVMERMIDQALPLWRAVGEDGLHDALPRFFHRPGSTVNWSRLLAWEGVEFGDPDNEQSILHADRRAKAYGVQVDLMRRAQAAGEADPALDPEMLSLMVSLLAMSRSLVPQVIKLTTGLDADSDEYADRLKSFVDTLFRGMAANREEADE
jgi:TetR/AcrR family transcriptional regulator